MRKFNIIDIGSAGLLSEPWSQHPEAVGAVLKFEPRDEPENTPGVRFLPYALWSERAEKDFFIYRGFGGTGSSLYRQNYAYVAAQFPELRRRGGRRLAASWFERSGEVGRQRVTCRTLDEVLTELHASDHAVRYEFLKVDAQGADLPILKGATAYLSRDCLGLQCELYTIPLYDGIALYDEAVAWLDAKGFQLWRKLPAHGSFLSQHDCIFIKRTADTAELTRALDLPVKRPNSATRVLRRLVRVVKGRA